MAFIYLIREYSDEPKYKIGVTRAKDIDKRMKHLQTGNSNELALLAYHKTEKPFLIEKMLHSYYKNKQVINEWFDLSIEDISQFQELCEKFENIIESLKDNPFMKINNNDELLA